MPRPKTWIPQFEEILRTLEVAPPARVYDRQAIQEMFGLSVSGSKELMTIAGATSGGSGLASTVSRDRLIAYVSFCPEVRAEKDRRERLAEKLEAAQKELPLRAIPVEARRSDEWTNLQDMPNVVLEPGRAVIKFEGGRDGLLRQLYLLSKALQNDYEALERMLKERAQAGFQFEENVRAAG